METTIKIDGKDVRLKSTAAVPMLYRRQFNRDVLQDMQIVAKAMKDQKNSEKNPSMKNMPLEALNMFERLAFIMAKHADPDMEANTPEEWMAGFSTLSIYAIYPVVQAMWDGNLARLEEAKKKLAQ